MTPTITSSVLVVLVKLFGMVQAWVGHFVTPLKCTYEEYNCVIGHGILAGTYLAEYRDSLK